MKCYTCGKDLKDYISHEKGLSEEPKYYLDEEKGKFIKLSKQDENWFGDKKPLFCFQCVNRIVRYFRLERNYVKYQAKCCLCKKSLWEKFKHGWTHIGLADMPKSLTELKDKEDNYKRKWDNLFCSSCEERLRREAEREREKAEERENLKEFQEYEKKESAPDSELEDYDEDGVYIGPDQDDLEIEKDEETGAYKLK